MVNEFVLYMDGQLSNYQVKLVTRENCTEALDVYTSNQAYFCLCSGCEVGIESIYENLEAIPPDLEREKKVTVGIWDREVCIGNLDFLIAYPNPDCLYVGLLLIHQNYHGKQIGRQVFEALKKAAERFGLYTILVAVVEENRGALEFWKKMGFAQVGMGNVEMREGRQLQVIKMEQKISRYTPP